MSPSLKFCYFGTPEFSTLVLDELVQAGFTPSLIVTAPDKPAGRGFKLTPSPVKVWTEAHQVPIIQPVNFKEVPAELANDFDLFIVAAYGKILPERVLALPKLGALNVHPSLLPAYRGTSPVESQILAAEQNVGVSVIKMDAEMDHGPIVAQEKIAIPEWPVSRNVANEVLWRAGGKLLARTIPTYIENPTALTTQDEAAATVTKKISKADGEISLDTLGKQNYLKYLAYEGWPGVYFFDGSGKRIKVTKAHLSPTGDFVIERVIPEGKAEVAYNPGARSPK